LGGRKVGGGDLFRVEGDFVGILCWLAFIISKDVIHTVSAFGLAAGRVSTGLIHATPGDIKSFKSSAERMADILGLSRTLSAALLCFACTYICEKGVLVFLRSLSCVKIHQTNVLSAEMFA